MNDAPRDDLPAEPVEFEWTRGARDDVGVRLAAAFGLALAICLTIVIFVTGVIRALDGDW